MLKDARKNKGREKNRVLLKRERKIYRDIYLERKKMTKGGLVIPDENEFTVQPDDETVTSREP